jgi:Flp pilus assembly protein TadD
LDATEQLQRLLRRTPNDVRIHLLLGNVYSQQLNQKDLARHHYEQVLVLNPRHPEASRIRFWIAANP